MQADNRCVTVINCRNAQGAPHGNPAFRAVTAPKAPNSRTIRRRFRPIPACEITTVTVVKYRYALDNSSDTLVGYAIDPSTGALSLLPGDPFPLVPGNQGIGPTMVAISQSYRPTERFRGRDSDWVCHQR